MNNEKISLAFSGSKRIHCVSCIVVRTPCTVLAFMYLLFVMLCRFEKLSVFNNAAHISSSIRQENGYCISAHSDF